MEKKSNNKIIETKKLTIAALFIAIGVILPQLFHICGPNAGKMFLPMFIPIFLAALLLPLTYSIIISIVVPILSFVLMGMPTIPMLYFMIVELIAYATVANLLSNRINIYINIILSLAISRTVYILSILIGANLLNMNLLFASKQAIIAGVITSMPGMILQIVLIPFLFKRVINYVSSRYGV